MLLGIGVATAQTQVKGKVVSQDDGQPVIGATVNVLGTSNGTITDVDGNFSMTIPDGKSRIKVSFLGMESVTLVAHNGMTVVLKDDSQAIDEIVVTGYGNYKKSSFTGAATTFGTQSLEDVPTVSLESMLAGNVPGVAVSNSSSTPGAVSSIRVRGMGSINASNDPLYVIDGTPMLSGDMNTTTGPSGYHTSGTEVLATLNPSDIESITVIKDAAAASLYGSRAANGVIVITTKQGKKGKTNINFRSDWGFSNLAVDYRPMLSGEDRRELLTLGLKNYAIYKSGLSEADATAYAEANIDKFAAVPEAGYADWKDLTFRTGHHQSYQLSVNGGGENTGVYASLSYVKQDGILYGQGLERFTGNVNVNHKFGRFTLDVSSKFSKMDQDLALERNTKAGAIMNYGYYQNPSSSPYTVNEDGSLSIVDGCGKGGVNPLYERQHRSMTDDAVRSLNSVKLTYNIWDNLNISEKISYDYITNSENYVMDKYSSDGLKSGGVAQRYEKRYGQLNTQTQLTYDKSFGSHDFRALLGYETEDDYCKSTMAKGSDFPGDLYDIANAGTTSGSSGKVQDRMESFLGKIDYDYADKYYLGASYRRDGSSRFSASNRWGDFWSVSGAWRFTAEDFAEPITSILTDGKIRLSYGVNGTLPSSLYAYEDYYKYGIRYDGNPGMGIVGIGNPDLKWEKNEAFNVGLDLTLLNRFTIGFDYYIRTTKDLIFDLPVSYVPGYYDSSSYGATMPQNVGSLENKGFELTLTSVNVDKRDFHWTTTLNIAHNSNKIKKLDGVQTEIVDGLLIHREGETFYSYYMYEYAGVDPETGNELYYINGDDPETARNTTTNTKEANKTIVGNHQPTVEGGLTNNIRWKFIDLGFTFTYSLGGEAYDYSTWQHSNGSSYVYTGATPAYFDISKMWTGPGDATATLPKFQYGSATVNSSRWLMPTDYLRLKNLTIGISAPSSVISKYGLSKARIYFSGTNLLTWKSKDLLVDPEMPETGLCQFETPAYRTFAFGIELGF